LDFSLVIWNHRNDEVHGATDDASKEKEEKILDAKITEAYQYPDQHSDNDRLVLFTKPLPDRLKTRYAFKVQWLSLRTHLLHAPDTPADEPPPPIRRVQYVSPSRLTHAPHNHHSCTITFHHYTINIHDTLMNSR